MLTGAVFLVLVDLSTRTVNRPNEYPITVFSAALEHDLDHAAPIAGRVAVLDSGRRAPSAPGRGAHPGADLLGVRGARARRPPPADRPPAHRPSPR
jgi:hypothetical protein